jgi:hypothetical protein
MWQTRRSQEPQVAGSNPSTCIEFCGRSSKRESASAPCSRLGVQTSSPTSRLLFDFRHGWPSGFRRVAAAHVRSVRFRRRALNIRRSGAIGRRAELKPPNTMRVRLPPSAFTAGIEQGRLNGLISHNQQVRLLPPLPSYLNLKV